MKKDENERGLNVTIYTNKNKFNKFGFTKLVLELTFKETNAATRPIKVRAKGYLNRIRTEFVFDYFNYERIDDIDKSNYQISPSIGCSELKDYYDKKPKFVIEDKMKIQFDDVSSLLDSIKRSKFYLDKKEEIARLETDDDDIQILDIKNKIQSTLNSNGNCELELYSSLSKFDELKKAFFKNVNLILEIKLDDFTFIGDELRNGCLMQKYQIIEKITNGFKKKTVFFKNVSCFLILNFNHCYVIILKI